MKKHYHIYNSNYSLGSEVAGGSKMGCCYACPPPIL